MSPPPPEEIVVDVTLKTSDLFRPFRYTWQNVARWFIACFCLVVVFETRPVWSDVGDSQTFSALIAVGLIVGLVFLSLFLFPYLRARAYLRGSPGANIPRRLTFTADGINVQSELARREFKWALFQKILEGKDIFYLMQSGRAAMYVPKRCFARPDDVLALRQLIRDNFHGERRLRVD